MSSLMIPNEAVEMAFLYLNNSSEEIAAARANMIRAEYKAKRVFARMFMAASGSVEARKAMATDSEEYAEAMERIAIAEETWERMTDQRNRAKLILEAWRTREATERAVSRSC